MYQSQTLAYYYENISRQKSFITLGTGGGGLVRHDHQEGKALERGRGLPQTRDQCHKQFTAVNYCRKLQAHQHVTQWKPK